MCVFLIIKVETLHTCGGSINHKYLIYLCSVKCVVLFLCDFDFVALHVILTVLL